LSDNTHCVVDTIDQKGAVLEANRLVHLATLWLVRVLKHQVSYDLPSIVLNGRHSSHLDTELKHDTV
jgi:hypothetical protein